MNLTGFGYEFLISQQHEIEILNSLSRPFFDNYYFWRKALARNYNSALNLIFTTTKKTSFIILMTN